MTDCIDCKAVVIEENHYYCEYDGCICHDNYDDSECEYFEYAEREGVEKMNVSVLEAIENVIVARSNRGTPKENLSGYVRHLINETWKNCPNICNGIREIANKYSISIRL